MRLKDVVRGPHGPGGPMLALSIALAGCTGLVTEEGSRARAGAPPMSSAGTSNAGTGGGGPATLGDPGVSEMHRLNSAEYNATVADVLGTTKQPANANWRAGESEGFDNIASQLGIDDAQFTLYLSAAEALAEDVFASEALRARIVTCEAVDDPACVTSIVQKTGLRLLRRPLLDSEVSGYAKAYAFARSQGEVHAGAVKHVLWAMLCSAEFLYRMEFDGSETGKHPISGYELASRLSYFLWSSAPDDALLAAADTLTDDAALSAAVDRLLADPKSARLVSNFAGQWLGARKTLAHPVALDVYPTWSPAVASAAAAEISAFFSDFLRNDRPWTEFMKADVNFVDGPLARFYGIPNVAGEGLQRVEYTGDQRAGFMGLAGFLATSSLDRRSAPTVRGKAVLVSFLCSPPQPAPGAAGKLEDKGDPTNTNIRQALAAHRQSPACGSCHNVMDPFGLALESFDGIGQPRTHYPNGEAVDVSTALPSSDSFPGGLAFSGLAGAADAIVRDPRFKECLTQKLFTYGLGRALTTDDLRSTQVLTARADSDGGITIKKAIRSLTMAEPFRARNAAKAAK